MLGIPDFIFNPLMATLAAYSGTRVGKTAWRSYRDRWWPGVWIGGGLSAANWALFLYWMLWPRG